MEKTNSHKASVVQKALVNAFPLIGNWPIWKIGNGSDILMWEDPWIGVKDNFILSNALMEALHEHGIFLLKIGKNIVGKKC